MSASDSPPRQPRKPVRRQSAALRSQEEARVRGSGPRAVNAAIKPRAKRVSASVQTSLSPEALERQRAMAEPEQASPESAAPEATIAAEETAVHAVPAPPAEAKAENTADANAASLTTTPVEATPPSPPTSPTPPSETLDLTEVLKSAMPAWRLPRPRLPRARLLPAMIFAATIMLGFRIGDYWDSLETDAPLPLITPLMAQDAEDPEPTARGEPLVNTETARAAVEPTMADAPAGGLDNGAGDEAGAPEHAIGSPAAAEPMEETEVALADAGRDVPDSVTWIPRPQDMAASEIELLQSLGERRETLDQRERQLEQQATLLQVAEQRIDEKMGELYSLREQLEGLLTEVSAQEEAHLTSLVQIYENMRPGDAATIFDGLELDVLISVLDRMREAKAASILAAMTPDRARTVTSELALRQQLPELPEQ